MGGARRRAARGRSGQGGDRGRGPRAAARPVQRLGVHGHARARGALRARAGRGPCCRGGGSGRITRPRRQGPQRRSVLLARHAARALSLRVLILSWEYPPVVEGGLARHVSKLSEHLVAFEDIEVHVLTRGDEDLPAEREMEGVLVHRVREPRRPRDLHEFVAWVEHMNADMLAAGVELGDRFAFDLVHGHDWLIASAGDHLARRFRCPLVMTIHATEYGRHQGWVDKHPQSYIHGVERWVTNRADRVITCSHYMRDHVLDIYDLDESRVSVVPNGIDPVDLQPVEDLDALRASFAEPDERLIVLVGRLVYEKGFQLALDALPGLVERLGNVRFLVAGSGTHEEQLREQATRLGLDDHGM